MAVIAVAPLFSLCIFLDAAEP